MIACISPPLYYDRGDNMLYAGLDVHKETVYGVVKTEKGKVIKEDEIDTEKKKIKQFFENLEDKFEVAIEATGSYEFFYEALEGMAENVHLANLVKDINEKSKNCFFDYMF